MYDFVSMYISPSLPTTIRSQPYTIYIYLLCFIIIYNHSIVLFPDNMFCLLHTNKYKFSGGWCDTDSTYNVITCYSAVSGSLV